MPYQRTIGVFDPYARYAYQAPDRALLAETIPAHFTTSASIPPTAGRLEFARIRLPVSSSVTNIVMGATAAGSTLTAGQCFAALYTGAGVLLAQTADQAAAWASAGVKTMALAGGAQALAAGNYYVGFWFNGTTAPTWARGSGVSTAIINVGTSAPNLMFGSADTGLTTTAPASMGAQTAQFTAWWAALS